MKIDGHEPVRGPASVKGGASETQEAGRAGRGVTGEEAAVPRACRACRPRGSLFPPEAQVWMECSLARVSHLPTSGLKKP